MNTAQFSGQQVAVGNQPPATSHQTLASSNQQSAIGYQPKAASDQQVTDVHQQPTTSNQLQADEDRQSAIGNQTQVSGEQAGIVQAVGQVVQSAPVGGDDGEPEVGYGGDKERAEVIGASENVPLVEIREEAEIEPEVEGWLEKLEQAGEVQLPQPVTHDDRVIVADAGAQITQDRVVLPVTLSDQKLNLKKKPEESAKWLAIWIERITKMFSGKFRYREEVMVVPASIQAQIGQQETKATGV